MPFEKKIVSPFSLPMGKAILIDFKSVNHLLPSWNFFPLFGRLTQRKPSRFRVFFLANSCPTHMSPLALQRLQRLQRQ